MRKLNWFDGGWRSRIGCGQERTVLLMNCNLFSTTGSVWLRQCEGSKGEHCQHDWLIDSFTPGLQRDPDRTMDTSFIGFWFEDKLWRFCRVETVELIKSCGWKCNFCRLLKQKNIFYSNVQHSTDFHSFDDLTVTYFKIYSKLRRQKMW